MNNCKGIILAGGTGTRLSPLTKSVNKQLLPIHDKPMIFYPLSVLMLANIRDILMIVNPGQIENFRSLLGDGSRYGIKIKYKIQNKPGGLPEAFILGKPFIDNDNVALILGEDVYEKITDIKEPVDIVDVFRPSKEALLIAEDTVKIGAKVLWLQLGIRDENAKKLMEILIQVKIQLFIIILHLGKHLAK